MASPLLVSLVKGAAAQRAANGPPGRRRSPLAGLAAIVLAIVAGCGLVISVIIGAAQPDIGGSCTTPAPDTPAGGGPLAAGLFAQPLGLAPGHSYEVGATEYGGPGDPTSSDFGSIPQPGESYLPSHPDSFAELSVEDTNKANISTSAFTFNDANALDNLPYLSALRIEHSGREAILYKRDTGYGQGPGQTIANGQPYRLDVWWQSAGPLAISKDPVTITLTPSTGAAPTLGQTAAAQLTGSGTTPLSLATSCAAAGGGSGIPLPLTPGSQTKILPSGLAAAGQDAPARVQAMVAAGNRLYGLPYLYGGAHGPSLDTRQPAYDCSSAVSYVLHAGGALGPSALDSTALTSWGLPGPGRYVSVYANSGHAFMYVAGLRFDTVEDAAFDSGPNSGRAGPRWRVFAGVPDWASWTVRHPPGL